VTAVTKDLQSIGTLEKKFEMSKISAGQAIVMAKCPKCREGRLFSVSVLSYSNLSDVNKTCSVCGANFVPEPDFYYGAMYISYAFSVALVITSLTAINVLVEKPKLWMYLTTTVVLNIFLLPAMLRYSKVLYLYWLGKLKYRGF
jgi:uncharacterized protein (DUF983 family)